VRIGLPIETERLLVRPFVPAVDAPPTADVYCDPAIIAVVDAANTASRVSLSGSG
jgi:hypothetical protein